jgi:hypothetical protein
MTTESEEMKSSNKGMMFYSFADEKIYIVDVNQDGELWILSGNMEDDILTSQTKERPNGSTMTIRFTHRNRKKDSFEALMEYSSDGGKSWKRGYYQYITREK